MIKFKPQNNSSHLSYSFYDNNKINHLYYNHLCLESKNIFNLSIFCIEIFNLYKTNIYKSIYEYTNINCDIDYDGMINNKLLNYFNDYVKIKDNLKINNKYIYKFIITYINNNNIIIKKSNYDNIYKLFIDKLKDDTNINYNNNKKLLFENIINKIIISIYTINFNKTKNEILNHIPLSINDEELINDVKNNNIIEIKTNMNYKTNIEKLIENKLKSDQNYISCFIYKQLGEKTKNLQSTLIGAVINKAYDSYSSFYALKKLGIKVNKPKYLKKEELYNLIYFYSDIVVDEENNNLKLYTSNNISKNFNKIISNDYIYVDNNKYVNKIHLKKIGNNKIIKKYNYIIDKYYIEKNNKNIIDSRYIVIPLIKKIKNIKMIEIKPVYGTFKIIYTYLNNNNQKLEEEINIKDIISIDLGVNNLLSIYDPTGNQYIIKGGPIKSLNYYITKKIGNAQKINDKIKINKLIKLREDKINDYFNRIITWMKKNYYEKKLIVIGYNKEWKTNSNLGKKSNLIFNKIPYMKLINKIKMKFNVITTEESYTSKCDSLNLEEIKHHNNYSGKRINRGLFRSAKKTLINADINGAINILRKQIKLKEITGIGLYNPITINIFHEASPVDNVQ
jgi:putative transposase